MTDKPEQGTSSEPMGPPPAGRRRGAPRRAGLRQPPRLAETPGPEPETPLADVRLTIGTLNGTHGIHGELKLRVSSDEPEHLRRVTRVWIGDETAPRRVQGVRFHGGQALIRLSGITTPEAGRALQGQPVRIAGSQARPLAPGEYFLYQLIGLDVFDELGNLLGRVTDLIETGANDVFVVAPVGGGADVLLPNLPDVVLEIRPAARRMTVRPLVYEGDTAPGEA